MSDSASRYPPGPSRHNEVNEDQVNEMWSEYLKNVDDYDRRLTNGWRDDANGVLLFTGLFSTIVASFIIESYKLLSPNSGSQTVVLLGQLSQQFAGLANGTYVQPQSFPSSPPSASIICVNILWLLSFLLSITSALFATLMLQWARIFIDLPQTPSVPKERARVRSFLFFGMEKYRMRLAVETAPTLLHLSVFLFFIGLVVFFFTIFKMVAVVILISVGVFGLAYLALTILPYFDHSCPYRTPMSSLWWSLYQISIAFLARYLYLQVMDMIRIDTFLARLNIDVIAIHHRLLLRLSRAIERFIENQRERLEQMKHLEHGFGGTVIEYARDVPREVDFKALKWSLQLPALNETSKIQKLVASTPKETITVLLTESPREGKVTFRHRLFTLFRSCTPGAASSGVDENIRRRCLSVCLNSVHDIAKASNALPAHLSSELPVAELWLRFTNIAFMRPLWADRDPAIRVTARSICALFARQLLRQSELEEGERLWLQEVIAKPAISIFDEQNNLVADVGNMNADAFVDGVLSYQRDDLPGVLAVTFKDTLKVLMDTDSHTYTFEESLSHHIRRIEQENDYQDRDNVVNQLRRMSSSTVGTSRPQSHVWHMRQHMSMQYGSNDGTTDGFTTPA